MTLNDKNIFIMDLIKRNLYWFMSLIAVMALGVSVTACSDDDDDDKNGGGSAGLTAGTWVYENNRYSEELTLEFDNDGEFYGDFRDDKTSYNFSGDYKQSGNSVKIKVTYCSSSYPYAEFRNGTVMTATLNADVMTLVVDDDRYILYLDSDDYDDDDDW